MSQSAYAAPGKLEEIVGLLASNPGSHLLAGGQSLLVEPRRSQIAGSLLVDLRKVAGLSGIQSRGRRRTSHRRHDDARGDCRQRPGPQSMSCASRCRRPRRGCASTQPGNHRRRPRRGGSGQRPRAGTAGSRISLRYHRRWRITLGRSRGVLHRTRPDGAVRLRSYYRDNHPIRRAFNRRSLRENGRIRPRSTRYVESQPA